MFKITTLVCATFVASNVLCQIPSGYYNSAEGQTGSELKNALHLIIDDHTEFSYSSSSTDVWDMLKETDKDPNNPNNVILIYSGVSVNAAQEYAGGNGWNREHVWAKSRGDFGNSIGPGTDAHHLRPCDVSSNSSRSNRAFNNCTSCSPVEDTWGNQTGSLINNNEFSFEPRDAVKGDVARMLFYMAVRYEGTNGEPDLELTEQILPSNDQQPLHGVLSTLLEWNEIDPVDDFERNRNNVIYSNFQGNRNPFIDHMDLANYVFGDNANSPWYSNLSIAKEDWRSNVEIVPNPVKGFFSVNGLSANDTVEVVDLNGNTLSKKVVDTPSIVIEGVEVKGVLFVRIVHKEQVFVRKIVSI
ncbi:MAG: endonuclease [Lishizhenia sp.]